MVDLTGGLGEADLDLAQLGREAREAAERAAAERDEPTEAPLLALTHPAGWEVAQPTMPWGEVPTRPEDLVVIVGPARSAPSGRPGPASSSRSRTPCPRPACWSWRGPPA